MLGDTYQETPEAKAETERQIALRKKGWDELNAEEKVERMRDVIKRLQDTVNGQRTLINKLYDHGHNNEGELVSTKKITRFGGSEAADGCIGSIQSNKVFF